MSSSPAPVIILLMPAFPRSHPSKPLHLGRRIIPYPLLLLLLTLLAGALRFHALDSPRHLVFDERYYATQGYSLQHHGYERELRGGYADMSDDRLGILLWERGQREVFEDAPYFSPHPPLGKWVLGVGQQWTSSPVGWRIMPALLGTLMVLLLTDLTRRLLRRDSLALAAGLLLAFDTLGLLMSRVGMLDISQAFFVTLALWCFSLAPPPRRGVLPSLPHVTTIIALGLATGVKWSGAYWIALFLLGNLLWGALRNPPAARVPATLKLAAQQFLLGMLSIMVYASIWAGWFLTDGGCFRHWSERYPHDPFLPGFPATLRSWLLYHREVLDYHKHFGNTQAVDAPWQWFLTVHPLGFEQERSLEGVQSIALVGAPTLWLLTLPALVLAVVLTWRRGARVSIIVPALVVLAGYVPWLLTARMAFLFYLTPLAPALILLLVAEYQQVKELSAGRWSPWYSRVAGAQVVSVILWCGYWYPLWSGRVIPWSLTSWYPYVAHPLLLQ